MSGLLKIRRASVIAGLLAGFCQAAGAQTPSATLTLYGLADTGVSRVAGRGWGMSDGFMNNYDSMLGVRGQEVLADSGLIAGFNIATALQLRDGSPMGYGGGFWGSTAHVWLQGGWGRLQLGRGGTPTYGAIYAWELTEAANYSAVGDTNWYGGTTYDVAGRLGLNSYASDQVLYRTPTWAGWSGEAAWGMKSASDRRARWDVNISYQTPDLVASAAVNRTGGQRANAIIGGRVGRGALAIAASFSHVHDASDALRQDASLGVRYRAAPWSLTFDVVRDLRNRWGGGSHRYTNWVLEGRYALSKNTFLYAATLRLDGATNFGTGVQYRF